MTPVRKVEGTNFSFRTLSRILRENQTFWLRVLLLLWQPPASSWVKRCGAGTGSRTTSSKRILHTVHLLYSLGPCCTFPCFQPVRINMSLADELLADLDEIGDEADEENDAQVPNEWFCFMCGHKVSCWAVHLHVSRLNQSEILTRVAEKELKRGKWFSEHNLSCHTNFAVVCISSIAYSIYHQHHVWPLAMFDLRAPALTFITCVTSRIDTT